MTNKYTTELKVLPLIPLRGMSIFPHMVIHFDVGREKSISALEQIVKEQNDVVK